jgi:hypothetical protein
VLRRVSTAISTACYRPKPAENEVTLTSRGRYAVALVTSVSAP